METTTCNDHFLGDECTDPRPVFFLYGGYSYAGAEPVHADSPAAAVDEYLRRVGDPYYPCWGDGGSVTDECDEYYSGRP